MAPSRCAVILALCPFSTCCFSPGVYAGTTFWNGTGTTWNSATDWSTSSLAATPNPATPPGAADTARFNVSTVNSGQTVNLDAAQAALGLVFNSTGSVLIQSGAGTNTLALGTGGITASSGAGQDTLNLLLSLAGAQTWTNNSNSTLLVNGAITNGTNLLTVGGTGNIGINGSIGPGTGGLTKNGIGTLFLGTNNTYTGVATINAGLVQLGNANSLGSTTAGTTVISGATLDLLGQSVGAEPLTLNGVGVGSNGALINSAGATGASGNIASSTGFTVGGNSITLSGSILGGSTLTTIGPGTLTLSGSTDNSGLSMIVNAGVVILAKTSSGPGGFGRGVRTVGLPGLTINSGGTARLGGTGGDQIYDRANVTVTGTGVFDMAGTSETIAALSLQGSLIDTGSGNSILTPTSGTTLSGNTPINVSSSANLTLNNPITGNFQITANGSGNLILAGNNTFTVGLSISAGTVTLANAGAVEFLDPNPVALTGAGILSINGNSVLVTSLSGTAGTTIQNGSSSNFATLTVSNNSNNTFAGTFQDGGNASFGLTKNGAGTLTLSGNNNFTGSLFINAGTLAVGNPNALGPNVDLTGGTLDLAGVSVGFLVLTPFGGSLVNSSSTPVTFGAVVNGGAVNTGGAGNINFTNSITNGPSLNTNGTGVITLSGSLDNPSLQLNAASGTVILAKNSSPTLDAIGGGIFGGINITGALVQLAGTGGDQIADNANISLTSGSFDAAGQSETFNALAFQGIGLNGNGALLNSAAADSTVTIPAGAALTANIGVTQSAGSLTLNAAISGNFAINKVGQGTLGLTGNNIFTGNLTIAAGTLLMNGGSLAANIVNNSNFTYNAATFNGHLINAGAVTLNADFIAANGMENDSTFSLAVGRTLTLNRTGLLNSGSFTMTGGNLVLSTSANATNVNLGNFYLSAPLNLGGATLLNEAGFVLNGGTINGGGSFNNSFLGTLSGNGTINANLVNGGTIALTGGTLNVPSFINIGDIELSSTTAALNGGTLTNNATIEGFGKISSVILNNGTLESTGGSLVLFSGIANTGTLRTVTGTKILMSGGNFLTNAGLVSLAGGTFDNGGGTLNNTGSIVGYCVLSTGGLTNNGNITFTGGTTTINGNVTNAANKTLNIKFQPAIFTGNITNNGTIKTTTTTVTFAGNHVGNNFTSDPATNIFQANATTIPGGLMTGSTGDVFVFNIFTNSGTFTNGGNLSVSTSITNAGTFTQSGPQSWSANAAFANTAGTATFSSNAKLANLLITGGTVDLTTSKFVIEPTSITKSTTLAALQADVASGSLFSSTLPPNLALAVIDNDALATPFTLFGGLPVDTNSLLIAPELLGDTDLSGTVDLNDLNTVLNNLGTTTAAWTSGNFDGAAHRRPQRPQRRPQQPRRQLRRKRHCPRSGSPPPILLNPHPRTRFPMHARHSPTRASTACNSELVAEKHRLVRPAPHPKSQNSFPHNVSSCPSPCAPIHELAAIMRDSKIERAGLIGPDGKILAKTADTSKGYQLQFLSQDGHITAQDMSDVLLDDVVKHALVPARYARLIFFRALKLHGPIAVAHASFTVDQHHRCNDGKELKWPQIAPLCRAAAIGPGRPHFTFVKLSEGNRCPNPL